MTDKEKENIDKLYQQFDKQKQTWCDQINQLTKDIVDPKLINQSITFMLSYRQQLVEKIAYINYKIKNQKALISKKYRETANKYSQNDISQAAKDRLVEAELDYDKLVLSYLENHLNFLKESVKTLDTMSYSIRYIDNTL